MLYILKQTNKCIHVVPFIFFAAAPQTSWVHHWSIVSMIANKNELLSVTHCSTLFPSYTFATSQIRNALKGFLSINCSIQPSQYKMTKSFFFFYSFTTLLSPSFANPLFSWFVDLGQTHAPYSSRLSVGSAVGVWGEVVIAVSNPVQTTIRVRATITYLVLRGNLRLASAFFFFIFLSFAAPPGWAAYSCSCCAKKSLNTEWKCGFLWGLNQLFFSQVMKISRVLIFKQKKLNIITAQ